MDCSLALGLLLKINHSPPPLQSPRLDIEAARKEALHFVGARLEEMLEDAKKGLTISSRLAIV